MNNFDGQNRKWFGLCSPNLCTHNSGSKVKKEEAISLKCYCYVSLIHNWTVHIYAMPPWENTAKVEQKGHTFTQETEVMSWICKHPRGGWNHPMNAPLICWHPSLLLLSPGRGWLQLQAVRIGQLMLECPQVCQSPCLPGVHHQVPGAWVARWSQGLPMKENSPKFSISHFFHFPFPSRMCLPLRNLQTSPAQKHGRREVLPSSNRTSSVAEI